MKRQVVSAVAVLALAAATLTSCRTNVGAAATVSGHRISENTVSDYVNPSVTPTTTSSGQTVPLKPSVLQILVLEQVFSQTLRRATGSLPTDGELAAVHDDAISTLTQGADPSTYDAALRKSLAPSGLRASLAAKVVRVDELEYLLITRLKLTKQAELAAAIRKAGVTVRVNPRYGSWNAANAEFSTSSPTPAYLKLQQSV